MAGILSKPPKKQSSADRAAAVARKQARDAARKPKNMQGLDAQQSGNIRQTQSNDAALGQTAANQLGAINDAYSQPFDWSQLPKSPWSQGEDLKGMSQKYQDEVYSNFARNAEPVFQKQLEDFDQSMSSKGIPIGSELYNRAKKELLNTQEGQRQSIRTDALTGSSQYAGQWNDIGTQNYSNAYAMAQAKRNMPLSDYNAIMGARSGMDMQNLGYSQALGAQNNQAKQNVWQAKNTPRGGGGGGGGGAMWQQYGFSSPQEYDAYKTAQIRDQQQWEWSNKPKDKGPSAAYQLGGQAIGTGMSLLGQYAMSKMGG